MPNVLLLWSVIRSRTKYHKDWVTKAGCIWLFPLSEDIRFQREVGFVSQLQAMVTCSLDGEINICDVHTNQQLRIKFRWGNGGGGASEGKEGFRSLEREIMGRLLMGCRPTPRQNTTSSATESEGVFVSLPCRRISKLEAKGRPRCCQASQKRLEQSCKCEIWS